MEDQIPGDPDRVDLAPLDPRADASRFERIVREIQRAAASELVRRQTSLTLWGQIARWRRPILSTSGLLALASAIVVLAHPSAETQTTVPEAFGASSQVVRWLEATDNPTPGELLGLERSEP